ncbi:MAG TPA: RNA polymerase sigma factor [Acidimicrobiales bacterium]
MDRRHDVPTETTDEALLSGIAVGDERSVLTFVRRYQGRLFGMALSVVGDPGLAEEVAQEAFIRILRHAAVFDARRGSVVSWTLTITRNLAIDALRLRRAIPTAPDDWIFTNLVSGEIAPDDAVVASDSASPVVLALSGLPRDQRRAIVLAVLYGRTAAEIADEESIPIGTAKSRIRLGMAKLRESVVVKGAP